MIKVPILGEVDAQTAFDCAHSPQYFTQLIEAGHDPLWTYRYISYRLHGVYKETLEGLGKLNYLVCTGHVVKWLRDNLPDDDE